MEIFGDVHKRKDSLIEEIKVVHDALEVTQSDALLRKEEDLLKTFDVVLEQEEVLWF